MRTDVHNRIQAGYKTAIISMTALSAVTCAFAQGTAFTYQGQLDDLGAPAAGSYDIRFTVWDASVVGTQLAGPTTFVGTPVVDGLFSVELDFGSGVFKGPSRWLEIGVQTNGGGGFIALAPRTRFTSTPFAVQALSAQSAASVPSSAIGSSEVANNSLTANDLGPNSVGSSEVVDNSLTASDLGTGSVGALEIATGAVGASEIAASAVGTSEVANGSLTTTDLNLSSVDARYVEVTGDTMSGTLSLIDTGNAADLWIENTYPFINLNRISPSGNNGISFKDNGSNVGWLMLNGVDNSIHLTSGGTGTGDDVVISSSGLVGIGRKPTTYQLELEGSARFYATDGTLSHNLASTSSGGYHYLYNRNETATIVLDGDSGVGGYLSVRNTNGSNRVVLDGYGSNGGGSAYLYAADGSTTVAMHGEYGGAGAIEVEDSGSAVRIRLDGESTGTGGEISVYDNDGTETVQIIGAEGSTQGAEIALSRADGTTTITLDADFNGDGRITTQELEITGGSDLSEQFDIDGLSHGVKPGMLVCIDAANPGKLAVSSKAYDRTVAGVVSGAGGVKPGMLMGQRGSVADGDHPVALTGRVYCMVDASQASIEPGDMITTSSIPGHGMKVLNHGQAQGAIIGKAMTPLADGQGMVLVLVSLQ